MEAQQHSWSTPIETRDVVVTRTLDATPEEVFAAWTDPDRIEQWWGPRGFHAIPEVLDLSEGGLIHFRMESMHEPDYAWHGEFREVDSPERLAFSFALDDEPDVEMIVACTFEPIVEVEDGQTRTLMTLSFRYVLNDVTRGSGEGMLEMVDRLEEFLRYGAVHG